MFFWNLALRTVVCCIETIFQRILTKQWKLELLKVPCVCHLIRLTKKNYAILFYIKKTLGKDQYGRSSVLYAILAHFLIKYHGALIYCYLFWSTQNSECNLYLIEWLSKSRIKIPLNHHVVFNTIYFQNLCKKYVNLKHSLGQEIIVVNKRNIRKNRIFNLF